MSQSRQVNEERVMATAAKFQKVFSKSELNAIGKEVGLCERERTITVPGGSSLAMPITSPLSATTQALHSIAER